MGDDGQIMELPVPKTPDGAHRLGLAIDAQLRAERWAARRRLACWVALAVGGMVVVDSTFAFLSAAVRRAFVAGWWVALAVTVVAAVGVRLAATYFFAVSLGLGLVGVWMGSTADWVCRSALLGAAYARGKWRVVRV